MNMGMFREPTDLETAALRMARHAGCNCDPDIEVVSDPQHPRMKHCNVHHDDYCRLLTRLERRN